MCYAVFAKEKKKENVDISALNFKQHLFVFVNHIFGKP